MKDVESDRDTRKVFNQRDADILTLLSRSRRRERPFSLLDLIELGTLDLELAAWLISHVSRGASFIIGAEPGGAGKTTTMRALLSFAPDNLPLAIAQPGEIANAYSSPHCVISFELSDHRPPGYLWGQDLRDFLALSEQGHMRVSNMHADDLDQAHAQICDRNGVPESHFRAVNLFVFIGVEGQDASAWRVNNASARRYINEIFYSDGAAAHELVFTSDKGLLAQAPRDATDEGRCRRFLSEALVGPSKTIEEIRRLFLERECRL
jgi:hypothetical protein